MRFASVPALVAVLLVAVAPTGARAVEELPPYWIAVSVGGAQLEAGPDARPPAPSTQPLAAVAPGQTVNLRAKVVGGRRAYMMWPETYANTGPNTTIEVQGFDRMAYAVQTEAFFGRGEWTVTDETYTWNIGGQGALSAADQVQERVIWTAPDQLGTYTITVSGQVRFHFVRQAPGGTSEEDEDSGQVSRTVVIAVQGPAKAQTMTRQEALSHILQRFQALGGGPVDASWPTYVAPAGFWNNVYSVFTDRHDNYVCGSWQGQVLEMIEAMRNGTATERAAFDHYDYGPIQAYYGGHQAVVIYPKGTDWRQTGTVLDPWPNQQPETFTVQDWGTRFWFGVGPSSVYQGRYPLTGAADYPKPHLPIPEGHMAILRRLPPEVRRRYLDMTNQTDRAGFIATLPAGVTQSTAVAVQSPVRMLITDSMGRRVGRQDQTTFVYEIPGADVDVFPEPDGSFGMVALLPYADYEVKVTGDAQGTFSFLRAMPATVTASPLSQSQDIPIAAGQTYSYRLSPSAPDGALMAPDGSAVALAAVPVDISQPTTTGPPVTGTGTVTTGTIPPATGAGTVGGAGVTITMPREGDRVQGRVEVRGTGRPGALIVVSTEVRAQDNDELLRDVPGSRHKINAGGTWQVWVAAPELPANIMEPLYYVIKAHWVTPNERSEVTSIKVYRAE